jgi:hypothetical protein
MRKNAMVGYFMQMEKFMRARLKMDKNMEMASLSVTVRFAKVYGEMISFLKN